MLYGSGQFTLEASSHFISLTTKSGSISSPVLQRKILTLGGFYNILVYLVYLGNEIKVVPRINFPANFLWHSQSRIVVVRETGFCSPSDCSELGT